MTKVPRLNYDVVVRALRHDGWVPAHRPIKRSTLSHILKHARLSVDEFEKLL